MLNLSPLLKALIGKHTARGTVSIISVLLVFIFPIYGISITDTEQWYTFNLTGEDITGNHDLIDSTLDYNESEKLLGEASMLEGFHANATCEVNDGEDFTINCWAFLTPNEAGTNYFNNMYATGYDQRVALLYSSGWWIRIKGNGDSFKGLSSSGANNTLGWHMITGSYNATNNYWYGYIDGVLQDSTQILDDPPTLEIIEYYTASPIPNVDECALFNKLLSNDEIVYLFNGGDGLRYPYSAEIPAELSQYFQSGELIIEGDDSGIEAVIIDNSSLLSSTVNGSCQCPEENDPFSIHTDNSNPPNTIIDFPYGINVYANISNYYNTSIDLNNPNSIIISGNQNKKNGLNISFGSNGYPTLSTNWYSGINIQSPINIVNRSSSAIIAVPYNGGIATFRHSTDTGETSIGTSNYVAQLLVYTNTSYGKEAVQIDQNDDDKPFIDYEGRASRSTAYNICRGGTASQTFCLLQLEGFIRNEINSTEAWIPYYYVLPPEP